MSTMRLWQKKLGQGIDEPIALWLCLIVGVWALGFLIYAAYRMQWLEVAIWFTLWVTGVAWMSALFIGDANMWSLWPRRLRIVSAVSLALFIGLVVYARVWR